MSNLSEEGFDKYGNEVMPNIEARQQERGLPIGDDPLKGRRVRHVDSERFHALLKQIGELHDRKQADYGSVVDPFANLRSVTDLGLRPWIAALVRMSDKMSRLKAAARGQPLLNETIHDTFFDLAVYSLIASILYEDDYGVPSVP